jgi:ubiquinone/menaquinone biosynthesis C-methylase UbiE
MRNEDCTDTSFDTETLDGVLSFDVMEHFPQYETAIKETFRVLRHRGVFFWTAPFDKNKEKTSVRANLLANGTIEYLMDPIMHGDPINPSEGILCFQIFGWDILESMRNAGFSEVKVVLFWSKSQVILGDPLPFFIARK